MQRIINIVLDLVFGKKQPIVIGSYDDGGSSFNNEMMMSNAKAEDVRWAGQTR